MFPWFRNPYPDVKELRRLLMPNENRKMEMNMRKKKRKRNCWYMIGKKWWYSDEGNENNKIRRMWLKLKKTRVEGDGWSLRSRRYPPPFEAPLAECSYGGLWVVARWDGLRRSHGEPRRDGVDRCFGLRKQPLSLVVASATHVGGFFLRGWWWHCCGMMRLFDFRVDWLVDSVNGELGSLISVLMLRS
jgi:hypothetical protein